MRNFNYIEKNGKYFNVILWALIFLYPFINSFLGIDLGDTGTHYMNFKYFFSNPDIVGFSSFFTSLIGWTWLQFFEGLGLWGLNFLEVIVEWLLAAITYNFLKHYFNRTFVLIGILLAVVASGCYLNVFNYHQFSVLLIEIMLINIVYANIKGKYRYSIVAGIFLGLAISARVSSIICCSSIIIYIYWYLLNDKSDLKRLLTHLLCFGGSGGIVVGSLLGILKITGQWSYFVKSMFKLSGMAATESGAYSTSKLLNDFVFGNLNTLASGVLTIFSAILFGFGIYFFLIKEKLYKKKILNYFVGVLLAVIAVIIARYSYDVNPVNNSPQFTTGPNYISGILYTIIILLLIYSFMNQKIEKQKEKSLIYIISIFLPLFIVASSSTQTKHVIISMWLAAPILADVIGQLLFHDNTYLKLENICRKNDVQFAKYSFLSAVLFFMIVVGYKYIHMIYWTNNFESVNRLEITETVESASVKYLRTTKREADAINAVIDTVKTIENKNENNLMVFGQGVFLYEILEGMPYIKPWVTDNSYMAETFSEDLAAQKITGKELPIIVYCRTNQYFGFAEEDYHALIDMVLQTTYWGKKDVLLEFLKENNYVLNLDNDYYYVFSPSEYGEGVTFEEYSGWL